MKGEEARGPWAAGAAGSREGSPLPVLGTAQSPELGFLNFLVFHNTKEKNTGHGVPALKVTSVSPQACHSHLLSLRY